MTTAETSEDDRRADRSFDLLKKRIDLRAAWVNSLLLLVLLLACLILVQRIVDTAALAQRNIALLFLRNSFVRAVDSFYSVLSQRAKEEHWSSYWLELRAGNHLVLGVGNQLNASKPYKSFRVTISRDESRGPWFEPSATVEALGVSEQERAAFQVFVDQQFTAGQRASVSDVYRQLDQYSPRVPAPVTVGGFTISFASLPLLVALLGYLTIWQMHGLAGDEATAIAMDRARQRVDDLALIKGSLLSDDFARFGLDPFSNRFAILLSAIYLLALCLTGWEPNLFFALYVPPLKLSPSLGPLFVEYVALAGVARVSRRFVVAHREMSCHG